MSAIAIQTPPAKLALVPGDAEGASGEPSGGNDGAGTMSNVIVGVAGVCVTAKPKKVLLASPETIALDTP